MKIEVQVHGSVSVLVPHGPLAGDELGEIRQQLREAIEQKSGRVVLDLSDVPYLDSGGIEALAELCAGQQAASARPRLAQLNDTTREALDLTDVLERLTVFDTVESAIRSHKR
jgi:anti-sigma B factor antagonist